MDGASLGDASRRNPLARRSLAVVGKKSEPEAAKEESWTVTAILIIDGDRFVPAKMIGTTNQALIPGTDHSIPRSFKSAKQARRHARKLFGAGNLDMRKFKFIPARGQHLQCGNMVTVEEA